ncbi:hypothetical protein PENSPDRAFT_685852 [Peniophora sp. CONT]|nr:hypothetical protein PENSPDRAFT_685852 [Peniophora sp. CONT]
MSYNISEVQLDSPVADVKDIADFRAFPLLLETTLIGVFTVQTASFVQQRCSRLIKEARKPPYLRSKPKPHANLLLGLAIGLYFLAVAYWAIDIALLRQELYVLLPNQVSDAPDPRVYNALADLRGAEKYAQAIIQVVIWSISDCITLWRAYVILERPRWLGLTILLLLFLEFADYVVYLTLYLFALTHPPRFIAVLWQNSGGLIGTAPFVAASSLTATVQVFATSLIAYKAWSILQSRRGVLHGPGRNFRTLSVFIESGVAYTVLWIWYAVGANNMITSKTTAAWTDFYVVPITAMYPTLVMMIVTVQDSVLADADNWPSRASSFRFAKPPCDAESGVSSVRKLQSTPPGLGAATSMKPTADKKNMDEKGFDTVCRVDTAHLRLD